MQILKRLAGRLAPPSPPMIFQWHITERCNLACTHCYQNEQQDELPLTDLAKILEQIVQFLDFKRKKSGIPIRGLIPLTGGEPLLHPDVLPLVEKITKKSKRLRFSVLTNGTLIDRDVAHTLADRHPTYVQVSIEGPRWLHDQIRGPGSFDKAVKGIEHLLAEKIQVLLSFTVHQLNASHFTEVVKIGCELGVQKIWADRLVPIGKGKGLAPLDPEDLGQFFKQMHQARTWAGSRGYATVIAMQRALQFQEVGGRPYRCRAGDSLITIMADGTVVPCRRLPIIVGNTATTNLAEIYQSSPLLQRLRAPRIVPDGCESCNHVRDCQGGAHCLAFAADGDPFVADPGCLLARPASTQ